MTNKLSIYKIKKLAKYIAVELIRMGEGNTKRWRPRSKSSGFYKRNILQEKWEEWEK